MQVMHLVVTLSPTSPVPPASFVPLGTAGFTLPLCTNVLAMGLIVFRIWSMTPMPCLSWSVERGIITNGPPADSNHGNSRDGMRRPDYHAARLMPGAAR